MKSKFFQRRQPNTLRKMAYIVMMARSFNFAFTIYGDGSTADSSGSGSGSGS